MWDCIKPNRTAVICRDVNIYGNIYDTSGEGTKENDLINIPLIHKNIVFSWGNLYWSLYWRTSYPGKWLSEWLSQMALWIRRLLSVFFFQRSFWKHFGGVGALKDGPGVFFDVYFFDVLLTSEEIKRVAFSAAALQSADFTSGFQMKGRLRSN